MKQKHKTKPKVQFELPDSIFFHFFWYHLYNQAHIDHEREKIGPTGGVLKCCFLYFYLESSFFCILSLFFLEIFGCFHCCLPPKLAVFMLFFSIVCWGWTKRTHFFFCFVLAFVVAAVA